MISFVVINIHEYLDLLVCVLNHSVYIYSLLYIYSLFPPYRRVHNTIEIYTNTQKDMKDT